MNAHRALLRLFLFLLVLPAWAWAQAAPAPTLAAKSWILVDQGADQILAAQDADARVEPASLTKLMTAYLAFTAVKQGKLTLTQTIPVSEKAKTADGSRMFIDQRRPVTVDELLHGMIIQSGNDASIALAEAIAGSEEAFVQSMNREAQRIGLANTNFMNATGLPNPQHYSTAHDLAILAARLIRDFPEFYPLYAQKDYRYNDITQPNRNRLLWLDPTVDGMKTGHTEAAGYCLVASSQRGTRRLVSVVLGAQSDVGRAQESLKLLNYGFQNFDAVRLYEANRSIAQLKVFKGAAGTLRAGFLRDLIVSLPKGMSERISVQLVSRQPLIAPVQAGQTVATLKLLVDAKPYAEFPVVAIEDVSVAGFFGRLWDTIRLWFE